MINFYLALHTAPTINLVDTTKINAFISDLIAVSQAIIYNTHTTRVWILYYVIQLMEKMPRQSKSIYFYGND